MKGMFQVCDCSSKCTKPKEDTTILEGDNCASTNYHALRRQLEFTSSLGEKPIIEAFSNSEVIINSDRYFMPALEIHNLEMIRHPILLQ